MTDRILEPFCPIYREAIAVAPWRNARSAHTGLLFDKFANAWRYKVGKSGERVQPLEPEFDKGTGQRRHGANDWLKRFHKPCGNPGRLAEACRRQRQLVEALGGRVVFLTNTSRFVTGMGREHPLENGFAWHHTLGVPYLPGSSLKGMLRAWIRQRDGKMVKRNGKDAIEETEELKRWLGTQGRAGQVILMDMLPIEPPRLAIDVMTPHYGPYYQAEPNNDLPGDWHSPVPIAFLVVEADASWQLGIVPATGARAPSDGELETLSHALMEAIEISGAGAKTAVGYGRFQRDEDAEKRIRQQDQQRRLEQDARQREAAEQAAFEASLAADSEPLRRLKKLQREQGWQLNAGDQNMMQALQEVADSPGPIPQDCIDWIRDLLESIPNYKGVWDNPDATKGKAEKPKFKYSSARIRELVNKLRQKEISSQ